MSWDKRTKPPSDFCPGQYCFHWVPPGGSADMSGREYDSFEEAITRHEGWKLFPNGGCGCSFGNCTRLDPAAGDHDCYEPHNLNLKRDGLPWFYFIPTAQNLSEESREEYLRESKELWGDEKESEDK